MPFDKETSMRVLDIIFLAIGILAALVVEVLIYPFTRE